MEVEGFGRMKIKLYGDYVKLLDEVRCVPVIERNLTSFDKLDSLCYGYLIHGKLMSVSRGALVIMKGERLVQKFFTN